MENQKLGRQTFQPGSPPVIIGHGSAAGHKESSGPLGGHFDHTSQDDTFGCKTWEQAESAMQGLALDAALKRAGLHTPDLDLLLAGDLLNQCIGAGYAARSVDVPFFGLYGACSTMGESLALATLLLSGGYGKYAAAVTSSHFCSAERQYRTPLEYGSQRTPTAQWTATAAGAVVVTSAARPGPRVARVTVGRVKDKGITDANNMGAAMAPADARLTQYISNRWYDCVTHPPSQKCRAEKARMGISINSSPAQGGGGGRSLAGRLPPYCFPGGVALSKEPRGGVGVCPRAPQN
ncbi:MAG: hypothetical protein K2K53_06270, partial [Oscillospiraceae bacterium]|nr:hypothetical protein [Oscillospiraceae bacterium]